MTSRIFGTLPSGEPVEAHTLASGSGASMEVLTYGGIVASLLVPDRDGRPGDVALGFNDLAPYLRDHAYYGALTGRIAGRIAGGRLSVDGRTYTLPLNNGANHLHGGPRGLDSRIWAAQPVARDDGAASLRLAYVSPDGEEGYPGRLDIAVTYTLTAANELLIESEATSDRPAPLSLTQHSYFNLAGEGSGDVMDQEFQIFAEECVPLEKALTFSDRRQRVAGTGADFRRPRRLGDALPDMFMAHGDLYLLRAPGAAPPASPTLAARAVDNRSGRVLEVFTDEACLQFYTGVALSGTIGKSGSPYGPHAGFCLECEGYSNASRLDGFGDIVVRPGRPQRRRTIYAFSTR